LALFAREFLEQRPQLSVTFARDRLILGAVWSHL
jgi:hypothetical protein